MKKLASCIVGLGLTALALSGCAAPSAPGNGSDLGDAPSLPVDPPSEIEIAAIPNEEFASAVVPVLESFPNDYAFFYFDSEHKPVIGFTDKAVPTVMEAVTSTGQQAQIIEDTGFTQAEYRATAEKLIVDLHATWPQDVPFPMIDVRPDLGVGAIGAILVTPEDSSDSARSIQESTRLIEEADTESPFSIQIDEKQVFGEGEPAS